MNERYASAGCGPSSAPASNRKTVFGELCEAEQGLSACHEQANRILDRLRGPAPAIAHNTRDATPTRSVVDQASHTALGLGALSNKLVEIANELGI